MESIFTTDDRTQDLIDWAGNLSCLGGVIQSLSENNDTDTLSWYGVGLGRIIQNYAQAIEKTIDEAHSEIQTTISGFDFTVLGKIDRRHERIKSLHCSPHRDGLIEKNTEAIREFKKNISPIFRIENELESIRNPKIQKTG